MLTGKDIYGSPEIIDTENNSVAFFGVTRSGKSTQIKKLLQNNTDTLNIVLDLKGEYLNRFYKPGDKVLCLHDTENFPNEKWSIMREILSSPYPETAAAEIADSLFAEAVRQSSQTFFPRSARTVWEVYTRLMIRKFSKTPPTNLQLITSILSFDADKLIEECKKIKNNLLF